MWKDKLKEQFDENPVAVIGVAGLALAGVAKVINALSASQGRRAYAKQVNHRIKTK